jgi:hypothetical protein
MNAAGGELLLKASFCSELDRLLARYQRAMEAWAKRRDGAWHMGLRGKELGGELLRLQGDFADSYAALHKHRCECPLCACAGKVAYREAREGLSAGSY